MAKRLILTALRLLLLNFIAVVLVLFFLSIENAAVQIIVEAVLAVVLWIFVWMECSGRGQNDVKKDKILKKRLETEPDQVSPKERLQFKPWFGFAAGALSQAISLIAVAAFFVLGASMSEYVKPIVNIINLNYLMISNQLNLFPWLYVITSLLFLTVAGFGYLNGPAQQRRIETIIERNTARKARRVQDDLKNKKAAQKKPVHRR